MIKAAYYADGGTVSAILRDGKGKELKFYADYDLASKTTGRITVGTDNPNQNTNEHYARSSDFAIALRDVFEEWLNQPLLAPMWKLSQSREKSVAVLNKLLSNPAFKAWEKEVVETKKWPHEELPGDHVYWVLLVYEKLSIK